MVYCSMAPPHRFWPPAALAPARPRPGSPTCSPRPGQQVPSPSARRETRQKSSKPQRAVSVVQRRTTHRGYPRRLKHRREVVRAAKCPAICDRCAYLEQIARVQVCEDGVAVERAKGEVEGRVNQRFFEREDLMVKWEKRGTVWVRRQCSVRSCRGHSIEKGQLTDTKANTANMAVQMPVLMVRMRSL